MRPMKCLLSEGSISRGEWSRPLGPGVVVDLDEVVGEHDGHPVTIEHLLAGDADHRGLLHAFEPVAAAAPSLALMRREEPADS